MEYYYNEDKTKIAVLVSHGFGAGWSTWNSADLAYERHAVEFWLEHHDPKFCREVYDDDSEAHALADECFNKYCDCDLHIYYGGYGDIDLEWVPCGTPFRIREYDGNERIETLDSAGFMVIN